MGGLVAGLVKHLDYNNLIAGMLAGVTATVILHPLELIKVRMQVDESSGKNGGNGRDTKSSRVARHGPRYSGVFDAIRKIYGEGGFRGLYQGVTPNIWGSGASWGCYFLLYNSLKSLHIQYMYDSPGNATGQVPAGQRLPAHVHMLSAFVAGAITTVLTNPIWMMKTRLCLQYKNDRALKSSHPSGKIAPVPHYSGVLDGLYKVVRDEGFFALYKGMSFGIMGTLHGVIQFSVYEQMKQTHTLRIKGVSGDQLPFYFYALYSGVSKIVAVLCTYPFQLIRSRLQSQHTQYTNGYQVIKAVVRNEGCKAFYKGIIPNLLRVTPASCITFVVYETSKSLLSKMAGGAGSLGVGHKVVDA